MLFYNLVVRNNNNFFDGLEDLYFENYDSAKD
jgi:hypothetical protein